MYGADGTSADFVNDPADNDPGAGIVVPDEGENTPLDLSTFGAFTIEAFIHPYTLRQNVIVRKYGGSPGQYYIDMTAAGNVRFSINADGNNTAAGDGAVTANEWYHVAAVFDETDLAAPMKIYVNGELKGAADFRDRPGDSPRALGIGCIIRDNGRPVPAERRGPVALSALVDRTRSISILVLRIGSGPVSVRRRPLST
jgi:hypothetical protein